MTNEMIKNVLEKKINATEMNDFYIDQIVYKQNACDDLYDEVSLLNAIYKEKNHN